MTPARWHGFYCLALLAALVLVQGRAEVRQWEGGYRPFGPAPVRVPYSWDMFAIRIDRCSIRWDPPIEIAGARVSRWHDRTFPLEFDTVYDRAQAYEGAAQLGCAFRTTPKTVFNLVCVHGDGLIDESSFACH